MLDVAEPDVRVEALLPGDPAEFPEIARPGIVGGEGEEDLIARVDRRVLEAARQRIADAGLSDRVTIELRDYRDIAGQFDRIVSIEMIEAVGRAYWPSYFETLSRSLKAGGRAVLQAITIDDALFESYQQGTDFIQRHIFPGGSLPSVPILKSSAEAAALAVVEQLDFGDSYALTLKEWRRRFLEGWSDIAPLGFDAPFRRLWEFYLCYCEAGFRARTIDVNLIALQGR